MNRNQICSYFSDGTQTVYEYSPSGNLLHVTGETGTISYSYNKAGLLVSQVDHGAWETRTGTIYRRFCRKLFKGLFKKNIFTNDKKNGWSP